MKKKRDVQFTGSKLTSHFKMNKETKRMMALMSFPSTLRISSSEVAELKKEGTNIVPLSRSEYKNLMMKGQLSSTDAKLTGLNDPLYKPKKPQEADTGDVGQPGNAPTSTNSRKGKKHPKMRPAESETVATPATAVDTKNNAN